MICGENKLLSLSLGICRDCILKGGKEIERRIQGVHEEVKKGFSPWFSSSPGEGIRCKLCSRQCLITEGGRGFCGLRENRGGKLFSLAGTPGRGWLHFYFDPHPTNCVAEWVCPERRNFGFYNLAVFYNTCNFHCLFCQNWHYRMEREFTPLYHWKEMVNKINPRTTCICFFGGDPTPQLPHALKFGEEAFREKGVRICWETNGGMNKRLLGRMVDISLNSGGIIKFDLKAYNPNLHFALTGTSNTLTLENFAWIGENFHRADPPLLVASTLLVPGYVEEEEVRKISRFIAKINPDIPYALLAFYPCFKMEDLPTTSRIQAKRCLEVAREEGLRRVRLGNVQLLS